MTFKQRIRAFLVDEADNLLLRLVNKRPRVLGYIVRSVKTSEEGKTAEHISPLFIADTEERVDGHWFGSQAIYENAGNLYLRRGAKTTTKEKGTFLVQLRIVAYKENASIPSELYSAPTNLRLSSWVTGLIPEIEKENDNG